MAVAEWHQTSALLTGALLRLGSRGGFGWTSRAPALPLLPSLPCLRETTLSWRDLAFTGGLLQESVWLSAQPPEMVRFCSSAVECLPPVMCSLVHSGFMTALDSSFYPVT